MPATAFDFELRLDVSLATKICATKFGVTCLHYVKQSTIFLRFAILLLHPFAPSQHSTVRLMQRTVSLPTLSRAEHQHARSLSKIRHSPDDLPV